MLLELRDLYLLRELTSVELEMICPVVRFVFALRLGSERSSCRARFSSRWVLSGYRDCSKARKACRV
jgi:hypothetical protein